MSRWLKRKWNGLSDKAQMRIIMGIIIGIFFIVFALIMYILLFVVGCHGSEPTPGVYVTKKIVYY